MGNSESKPEEGEIRNDEETFLSYGKHLMSIIVKLGKASENELTRELAKTLKMSEENARGIVQKVLKKALASGFAKNDNGIYTIPEFKKKIVRTNRYKRYKVIIKKPKFRKKCAKRDKAPKFNNNRRKKKR